MSEEIKKECEAIYESIRVGNERLKELRLMCKHENIIETNYSYRIGSYLPAIVCEDCGALIKLITPDVTLY
jgi:hypothetical protein